MEKVLACVWLGLQMGTLLPLPLRLPRLMSKPLDRVLLTLLAHRFELFYREQKVVVLLEGRMQWISGLVRVVTGRALVINRIIFFKTLN